MENLSPHKRFPGTVGVDVPTEVIIHRPIPRRAVPLKGIKRMLFPDKPLQIEIGVEAKPSWDLREVIISVLLLSPVLLFLVLIIIIMLDYIAWKFESFMAYLGTIVSLW